MIQLNNVQKIYFYVKVLTTIVKGITVGHKYRRHVDILNNSKEQSPIIVEYSNKLLLKTFLLINKSHSIF